MGMYGNRIHINIPGNVITELCNKYGADIDNDIYSLCEASGMSISQKNKKEINDCAKEIVDNIKKNGVNSSTLSNISHRFEEFTKTISSRSDIGHMIDMPKFKDYDTAKIINGAWLFYLLLNLQYMVQVILTCIIGASAAQIITICIICPLSEEFSKKLQLKADIW